MDDRPQAPPHQEAPHPDCTCGWYALQEPGNLHAWAGTVVEVDLYGIVVICENGYRAQKQRVLSVRVPRCWLCVSPPTTARFSNKNPHEGSLLAFGCDAHAPSLGKGPSVPTQDIALLLGTELRLGIKDW